MKKKVQPVRIRLAFAFVFLYCLSGDAFGAGQECMATYYREKSPACIDEILTQLLAPTTAPHKDPNTIIGFLAQIFRSSPEQRGRILNAASSDYMRSVDLTSLYRAGLLDEAKKFAVSNNLSAFQEKISSMRLQTLDDIRPSSMPGDNDVLIGAYMASGNTAFIQRVLENYSSADDDLARDGFRIGNMMIQFGPTLAPKGRQPTTMQSACEKYQCKADQTKLLRVMTLATASWSLQSLSGHDDGIKQTLTAFLAREPRLKTLYFMERTALGNYMTAVAGAAAFKNDNPIYETMNKSASIYETLGPADEALAAFRSPKK
jgi:hypothetical protein